MATCFVSLPLGAQFDGYFKQILAPAITKTGMEAVRGEDISRAHAFEQIGASLHAASVCVVDLTGQSANALYALGMAHAWGKPLIQLVQNGDQLPFDLKFMRHILYRPGAPRWEDMFSMQLAAALRELAPVSV